MSIRLASAVGVQRPHARPNERTFPMQRVTVTITFKIEFKITWRPPPKTKLDTRGEIPPLATKSRT